MGIFCGNGNGTNGHQAVRRKLKKGVKAQKCILRIGGVIFIINFNQLVKLVIPQMQELCPISDTEETNFEFNGVKRRGRGVLA